jgi:hypothetical protein
MAVHKVSYTLPYLGEQDGLINCIEVYLYNNWDNSGRGSTVLAGTGFSPREALEFGVKLAEAAIKLLSEEELERLKNEHIISRPRDNIST